MEEIKIRELPEKENVKATDYIIIEDDDGTKKTLIKHFRSLVITSLYFNNIHELKESANIGLKDGDICQTLGYHEPGDGGGSIYQIKYDPASVEDGAFIHYLSYSDTLRAELILGDTINVHQFGARGDGKTDDSNAIQIALDNSENRTIELSHGKKYLTTNTLNITKDNTVINGNGSIIYPQYVTGFDIAPINDDYLNNITINNLYIDCSKSPKSIEIYKSKNININKLCIGNIDNLGINIIDSEFINIDNCEFEGNTLNNITSIRLEGEDNCCCDFINITNCMFKYFKYAIEVKSTGPHSYGIRMNITNCNYKSTEAYQSLDTHNSCCIRVLCPVRYININSSIVHTSFMFLYFGGASSGNIYCNGITSHYVVYLFDIGSSQGILHLDGCIDTYTADTKIFKELNGVLHSNIIWDKVPSGSTKGSLFTGELFDVINPIHYNNSGTYTISEDTLVLHSFHNINVDWNNSINNITEITGGMKGQIIYINSSTNKSIIAKTNKIILSQQSIQLGMYSGILLKFDGLKWVQISYI